jgi:hypothetical protein
VRSARLGLVLASPFRPVECVGDDISDSWHGEAEQSAYFGEGHRYQIAMNALCRVGVGEIA